MMRLVFALFFIKGEKEDLADRFAFDLLIPPAEYRQFRPRTGHFIKAEIRTFSEKIGIAPGIVVGRLQHDKRLEISHLNGLKKRLIWTKDL